MKNLKYLSNRMGHSENRDRVSAIENNMEELDQSVKFNEKLKKI
jgi:hypothetical protein